MSHSLSASHRMWDPQVPALADKYRVVRYDTRGHGGTSVPPGEYTLDQLADDAVGLIRALGLGKVHFVGLSMGGMIGQTVALRNPEVLRSLVLCDTSSGYPDEARAMWADRIAAARRNGMAGMVDATIERWFSPGCIEREPAMIGRVALLALLILAFAAATRSRSTRRASNRISTGSVPHNSTDMLALTVTNPSSPRA
jgi:3-oxoadipate enol-lactonase